MKNVELFNNIDNGVKSVVLEEIEGWYLPVPPTKYLSSVTTQSYSDGNVLLGFNQVSGKYEVTIVGTGKLPDTLVTDFIKRVPDEILSWLPVDDAFVLPIGPWWDGTFMSTLTNIKRKRKIATVFGGMNNVTLFNRIIAATWKFGNNRVPTWSRAQSLTDLQSTDSTDLQESDNASFSTVLYYLDDGNSYVADGCVDPLGIPTNVVSMAIFTFTDSLTPRESVTWSLWLRK